MKLKVFGLTAVAVASAALVAACGGGGGSAPAAPSVQLGGVAAVGLAMANSSVDVKCAAGTGSTTTSDTGAYTLTISGGQLPCVVKVTGTAGGTELTLHSVAEAGTASGNTTTATANVTPLTEMIVARLAGTSPAALFENFGQTNASAVTTAGLAAATSQILTVLRDIMGVDIGSIDPFKTTLVADTATNANAGNSYDDALEALKAKVSTESLTSVVNQIASTSVTGGSSLTEVMTNVSAGSLAGCPVALSGKYRVVDYLGVTETVSLNFGTMQVTAEGSTSPFTMTASTTQACEFTVGSSTVVIGPAGAGVTRDSERAGFIFPVQAHDLASVQGKWEFLESGLNEANQGEHWVGEMDIGADGKIGVCDYNVMQNDFSKCVVDTEEVATLSAGSDGGFTLSYGASGGHVYGFRGINGLVTLFGTTNPGNTSATNTLRTNFVLTRPTSVASSPVGTTSKIWDIAQSYAPPSNSTAQNPLPPVLTASAPARNSIVVTESTATSVTRKLTSSGSDNGRIDTLQMNSPIAGLRSRAAGTDPNNIPFSGVYIRALPGAGISLAIDSMPNRHFESFTVSRP